MTATYAWIIDKDHLAVDWGIEGEEPEDEAGTTGPSDADPVALKLLTGGGGVKFRMYDGDGELYYEGRFMDTTLDGHDLPETAFGPLDDFGTPNAGCTHIKYFTNHKWETL